jgi:hypothetical protein
VCKSAKAAVIVLSAITANRFHDHRVTLSPAH